MTKKMRKQKERIKVIKIDSENKEDRSIIQKKRSKIIVKYLKHYLEDSISKL